MYGLVVWPGTACTNKPPLFSTKLRYTGPLMCATNASWSFHDELNVTWSPCSGGIDGESGASSGKLAVHMYVSGSLSLTACTYAARASFTASRLTSALFDHRA